MIMSCKISASWNSPILDGNCIETYVGRKKLNGEATSCTHWTHRTQLAHATPCSAHHLLVEYGEYGELWFWEPGSGEPIQEMILIEWIELDWIKMN